MVEKSVMKWFGWVVIGLLCCSGCNTQGPTSIGANFLGDGVLQTVLIDTLSLKVSTVNFDSVPTSTTTRLLIGSYQDQDLGRVIAKSYFRLYNQIAENAVDPINHVYERASMILSYDGYSYADTTQPVTLNVFPLTEQLKGESTSIFYNIDSFTHTTDPIGSTTFIPRPNSIDSVEIPIDDTYAKNLFSLYQNYDPVIRTNAEFFKQFPGFMVSSDTVQANSVLGFKKTFKLRLYYISKLAVPATEQHFDVNLGNNLSFNNIISNRNGTELKDFGGLANSVSSKKTSNRSYTQASTGLGVRVSIPYLKDILAVSPGLEVSRAILTLNPVHGSDLNNRSLPSQLSMYAVDKKNTVTAASSTTVPIVEDVYLGRDTHYAVDITSFVKSQLSTDEFNDNALLFTIYSSDFNSTVNRLYVENAGQNQIKVQLYYVSFNKKNE